MKFAVVVVFFTLLACQSKDSNIKPTVVAGSQIKIVDFEGLEDYIDNHPSQALVINFWATWCAPCIKELPAFEQLGKNYASDDVTIVLVSLDFPDQLEKLKDFVIKKKLESEVVFLDDGDANSWIPKVDKNWSGAIPATLIRTNKRKEFYERSFSYAELEIALRQLIK